MSASRLGSKFQAVPATGTEPEAEKAEKKKETKKEAAEEIYKVAFDYAADNADELTLNTGDLIKVRDESSIEQYLRKVFVLDSQKRKCR